MYKIPDSPSNNVTRGGANNVARRAAGLRVTKAKLAKIDDKYMKLANAHELKLLDFENKAEESDWLKKGQRIKAAWNADRAKLGARPSNKW
jgi:hypothetical protein